MSKRAQRLLKQGSHTNKYARSDQIKEAMNTVAAQAAITCTEAEKIIKGTAPDTVGAAKILGQEKINALREELGLL